MNDLKFIKGFGQISIASACRKCGVARTSLICGLVPDKEKEVREQLEHELKELYKECELNEQKDS